MYRSNFFPFIKEKFTFILTGKPYLSFICWRMLKYITNNSSSKLIWRFLLIGFRYVTSCLLVPVRAVWRIASDLEIVRVQFILLKPAWRFLTTNITKCSLSLFHCCNASRTSRNVFDFLRFECPIIGAWRWSTIEGVFFFPPCLSYSCSLNTLIAR